MQHIAQDHTMLRCKKRRSKLFYNESWVVIVCNRLHMITLYIVVWSNMFHNITHYVVMLCNILHKITLCDLEKGGANNVTTNQELTLCTWLHIVMWCNMFHNITPYIVILCKILHNITLCYVLQRGVNYLTTNGELYVMQHVAYDHHISYSYHKWNNQS